VIVTAIVRDKNPIPHYPRGEKKRLLRLIEAALKAKSASEVDADQRVIASPSDPTAAATPRSTFLTFPTPREAA
jgi:hypothetical protein